MVTSCYSAGGLTSEEARRLRCVTRFLWAFGVDGVYHRNEKEFVVHVLLWCQWWVELLLLLHIKCVLGDAFCYIAFVAGLILGFVRLIDRSRYQ